jgi:hypothetical protein
MLLTKKYERQKSKLTLSTILEKLGNAVNGDVLLETPHDPADLSTYQVANIDISFVVKAIQDAEVSRVL